MARHIDEVRGEKIVVRFEARRCIHSRNCVLGNPQVFEPNAPGEWIHPEAAPVDAVVALAHACPSGAVTYERLDGGTQEMPPNVNVVRVRENGPLAFTAEMEFADGEKSLRATLCRCGASRHKPFCDGSHAGSDSAAKFVATGEPATQDSPALDIKNGPLTVRPKRDGSLYVKGNLEICSGTGRTVQRTTETWLCPCGSSANKPFCDGTHRKIGFKADGV